MMEAVGTIENLPKDAHSLKITRKTIIGDIVRRHPFTVEIFFDYGVHCASCHVNEFETLEQGILGHGFSEGELLELIDELNDAVENPPEEEDIDDYVVKKL